MTKDNFSADRSSALQPVTRRRFLAGASASALSFSIIAPELVRGAEANSKVDIGLIGCGGRGQSLAPMFVNTGGYNMVAVADYFQDRTDSAGQKLGVPDTKRSIPVALKPDLKGLIITHNCSKSASLPLTVGVRNPSGVAC